MDMSKISEKGAVPVKLGTSPAPPNVNHQQYQRQDELDDLRMREAFVKQFGRVGC